MTRFRLTMLAPGVHLVRVLIGDGPAYDRMTTVTEVAEGAVVLIQGWQGKPLSPKGYLLGRDRHFPRAVLALFERVDPRSGKSRWVPIALPSARMGLLPVPI